MTAPPPMLQLTALVRIPARRCELALDAINGLGRPPGRVSLRAPGSARTLDRLLRAWRWAPRFNEVGDLTDLQFEGVRLDRDYLLMERLAPYIDNGCWIEMRAEPEGEAPVVWRWNFDAGAVTVTVADREGAGRAWVTNPLWALRLRNPGNAPTADTWSGKPERRFSARQLVMAFGLAAAAASAALFVAGWLEYGALVLGAGLGVAACGILLTKES